MNSITLAAEPWHFSPEIEEILDYCSRYIVTHRLETPALMLLEMHLPLVSLLHNVSIFLEPAAIPFIGAQSLHKIKLLLSERKNIEELMRRIEQYSIAKTDKNAKG